MFKEEKMNIEVRKLLPDLVDDYLDFFDNSAFCDGSEFAGCYCVWYHWTDELEKERSKCSDDMKKCFKRNLVINLIKQKRLNGFLAYLNGKVIGWCNADLKQNYDRLSYKNNPDLWIEHNGEKVMSIVCYIVSPNMRGNGVATELLKAVCKEAAENRYDYIEAYPGINEDGSPHYHGTYSMYEKQGFKLIKNESSNLIARKYL
jgi:GNAT superfamily N-acetyltransferase